MHREREKPPAQRADGRERPEEADDGHGGGLREMRTDGRASTTAALQEESSEER